MDADRRARVATWQAEFDAIAARRRGHRGGRLASIDTDKLAAMTGLRLLRSPLVRLHQAG